MSNSHDEWLATTVFEYVANGWDYHGTIKGSEKAANLVKFLRGERKTVKSVYDRDHKVYIIFTKPNH